jgi:two-component system chemotaxis response regulator CheY
MTNLSNTGTEHLAPASARPLLILLVEDDLTSRMLLQPVLGRYGTCHVASDGHEALKAVRAASEQSTSYDLICMDIMMPGMDGRETLRQLRAIEQARGIRSQNGAKVIMTTSIDDMKEVMRCFQDHCDGYLVKPVSIPKLLDLMEDCSLLPVKVS